MHNYGLGHFLTLVFSTSFCLRMDNFKMLEVNIYYLFCICVDPLQGDFPETIEEFLQHGNMKCIAFNRRGTLLAGKYLCHFL